MPTYTRTWNEAAPLGSSDPTNIDNFFRDGKVDFRERINSIIGVPIDTPLADPIIGVGLSLTELKAAADGIAGSTQITLPWIGVPKTETGTVVRTRQRYVISGATAAGGLLIPVPGLRPDDIITKVGALILYNSLNHTLTTNFVEMNADSDISSTSMAAGGPLATPKWIVSGTVAITVVADHRFAFDITMANNNLDTGIDLAVYAVRVIYTRG